MGEPREGKTHHVIFRDGQKSYGIVLDDDVRSIEEDVTEPFNLIVDPRSTRYGDFDPKHAHIEQRNWNKGGRHEEFYSDPDKYFDGGFVWSMTQERLMPAPLWRYATFGDQSWGVLPGLNNNIAWKPLVGNLTQMKVVRTLPAVFTTFSSYAIRFWIRKVGDPGALRVVVTNLDTSALAEHYYNAADVIADVATLWDFTTTEVEIRASDDIEVVFTGSDGDSIGNHWEVACQEGATGCQVGGFAAALMHFNDVGLNVVDETRGHWDKFWEAAIVSSQSKFGGASLYLDGVGDRIQTADEGSFSLLDRNFTLEMWLRPDQTALQRIFGQGGAAATTRSLILFLDANNKPIARLHDAAGVTYTTSTPATGLSTGTWYHVAVVRNVNTLTCYVNGTAVGSVDVTGLVVNDPTGDWAVGTFPDDLGDYYKGWIDEFYFLRMALYTADFTPPTAEHPYWVNADFAPYFEMTGNRAFISNERTHLFELMTCKYLLKSVDAGAGTLYVFGDRGKATAGSSTSVTDTAKTWRVNKWAGARVKIVAGLAIGKHGLIASNTATALTVTWEGTAPYPDSTSHYVIYNTPHLTVVTTTPSFPVSSIYAANNQILICYDNAAYMQQLRYDLSDGSHDLRADGTNYAQMVTTANHPVDGMQLYRIVSGTDSSTFSRAPLVAYGANHAFTASKPIDGKPSRVTSILIHSGTLYILKVDSAHSVVNDIAAPVSIGLDAMVADWNGISAISKGDFMYFPWVFSMERLYGLMVDDVGLWKDAGVPQNRHGRISKLLSVLGWIIVLVTPTSPTAHATVWVYDTLGWHEIWRSPQVGKIANDLIWEDCPGSRPRLWIAYGGVNLCYIEFPQDGLHPARDTDLCYSPENYMITSTLDMGKAQLKKLFSSLSIAADGISTNGNYVDTYYQTDDEIGTDTWHYLGAILESPTKLSIGLGNRTAIRFKLSIMTLMMNAVVGIKAMILEGVVRLPFSKMWTFRGRIASRQLNFMGVPDAPPDEVLDWMYEKAADSTALTMYSDLKALDGKRVIAMPPKPWRLFANRLMKTWGGKVTITFREV